MRAVEASRSYNMGQIKYAAMNLKKLAIRSWILFASPRFFFFPFLLQIYCLSFLKVIVL